MYRAVAGLLPTAPDRCGARSVPTLPHRPAKPATAPARAPPPTSLSTSKVSARASTSPGDMASSLDREACTWGRTGAVRLGLGVGVTRGAQTQHVQCKHETHRTYKHDKDKQHTKHTCATHHAQTHKHNSHKRIPSQIQTQSQQQGAPLGAALPGPPAPAPSPAAFCTAPGGTGTPGCGSCRWPGLFGWVDGWVGGWRGLWGFGGGFFGGGRGVLGLGGEGFADGMAFGGVGWGGGGWRGLWGNAAPANRPHSKKP